MEDVSVRGGDTGRGVTASRSKFAAHLALLAVVFVWGATFPLIKSALQDCTPLLFNQIRMMIAATLLIALNYRELRRVKAASLAAGAIVGILLALGYELQTAGLARTTASNNAFLTGLVVVVVPLLGAVPGIRASTKDKLRWPSALGALFAFAGIVLLTTPAGTSFHGLLTVLSTGDLLSLLCAFAFAMHLLAIGRTTHRMPSAQLATLQLVFCALAMTATTPLLEHPRMHLTKLLLVTWAITAVVGTAVAFSVQSWAQKHLPSSHTALLLALEPAFAWATSVLVLGERPGARSASGACAILAGLLVSELLGGKHPVAEQPEGNVP